VLERDEGGLPCTGRRPPGGVELVRRLEARHVPADVLLVDRPPRALLDEREGPLDVLGRVLEGREGRPEACVHLGDQGSQVGGDARELAHHEPVAVREEAAVEPRPRRQHDRRRQERLADEGRGDGALRLADRDEAREAPLGTGDQLGGCVDEVGEPHRARLRLLERHSGEHARAAREPVDHRLGLAADDAIAVHPPGDGEVGGVLRQTASERPSQPARRRREPAVGDCDHGARVRSRAAGVKHPAWCEARLKVL
jgi:hypothetical protein